MDYVYSANDGLVLWGPSGSSITMRPNDVWWADDPFVLARPDLFSQTPLVVHSTAGRQAPGHTPLDAKRKARGRG